jgi:hypothetical protein
LIHQPRRFRLVLLFALVYWPRRPGKYVRRVSHSDRRQHCGGWLHDRRRDAVKVDGQIGDARTAAILKRWPKPLAQAYVSTKLTIADQSALDFLAIFVARPQGLFGLVTQRLAGGFIDEVKLSTGWTGHDFVRLRLVRRLLGKQGLYVHARPRASKYDHSAHGANIRAPARTHLDPDQTHHGWAAASTGSWDTLRIPCACRKKCLQISPTI